MSHLILYSLKPKRHRHCRRRKHGWQKKWRRKCGWRMRRKKPPRRFCFSILPCKTASWSLFFSAMFFQVGICPWLASCYLPAFPVSLSFLPTFAPMHRSEILVAHSTLTVLPTLILSAVEGGEEGAGIEGGENAVGKRSGGESAACCRGRRKYSEGPSSPTSLSFLSLLLPTSPLSCFFTAGCGEGACGEGRENAAGERSRGKSAARKGVGGQRPEGSFSSCLRSDLHLSFADSSSSLCLFIAGGR